MCFVSRVLSTAVSFDGRSFLIDGERTLFIAGSIHYPRAPRNEWRTILQEAKDNGINLIQTYVFWDIHEPTNNEWNFPSSPSSSEDLVGFIQEAEALGLYVHLRISGYICAEWNLGGMPVWLRNINGTLRTYDQAWLTELQQFVDKTVSVVKSAGLLAGSGGPIVMLQIENEYGNMESYYGENGRKYVQWLSEYALSMDVGVPWVMCQQGEGVGTAPAKEIVNACNGFYCDNWIAQHTSDFPDQPHMWTENWPGWFQNWGEPVPHRPAVDVAFSVARWFARGGSYMNYYMLFGGSNFGRSVGGPLIVTSYDYDVQINEYAMRAEPKYSHLLNLHTILTDAAPLLLGQMPPKAEAVSSTCERHVYRDGNQCIAFLSNWGEKSSCQFSVSFPDGKKTVDVSPWSVSILGNNCSDVVYNTRTSVSTAQPANAQLPVPLADVQFDPFESIVEPIPGSAAGSSSASMKKSVPVVVSDYPLEQLSLTEDHTDYLWYSTSVAGVKRNTPGYASLAFMSGIAGGGVMYVYVDGHLAGSTLGEAGGPPIVEKVTLNSSLTRSKYGSFLSDNGLRVTLNISIPAITADSSDVHIAILSVSMGLKNYGPYLERSQVGIISNITLDGVVLTGITHSIGLVGEVNNLPQSSPDRDPNTACVGLCWYRSTFLTPASLSLHADSPQPLALILSNAMGKGAVWVNGQMLGRYWNITAQATATQGSCDASTCTSDAFVGAYNGDRCRSGCGQASQSAYKLPSQWLLPADRYSSLAICVLIITLLYLFSQRCAKHHRTV